MTQTQDSVKKGINDEFRGPAWAMEDGVTINTHFLHNGLWSRPTTSPRQESLPVPWAKLRSFSPHVQTFSNRLCTACQLPCATRAPFHFLISNPVYPYHSTHHPQTSYFYHIQYLFLNSHFPRFGSIQWCRCCYFFLQPSLYIHPKWSTSKHCFHSS